MAISYTDIEDLNRGREARAGEMADQQISDALYEEDQMVDQDMRAADQESSMNLEADAARVLYEMDKIADNGGDPMAVYNSLPPILQNKVAELSQAGAAEQQQSPAIPDIKPEDGNIVEQAKQVALR